MKAFILSAVVILFVSCADSGASEKVKNLNGYWNIDLVEKPDGSEKEFPFTNHMDHFEIQGNRGSKSRVSPTYDGSFISYGDAVGFVWEENENQLLLKFADGDGSYTQILREANDQELELVHEDGTVYHYKRFEPNAEQ